MDIDGVALPSCQCNVRGVCFTLGVSPDSSLCLSLVRAPRGGPATLANDFGLASPPLSRARKSASEAERGVLSLTQG
jgi:hypothetical protein